MAGRNKQNHYERAFQSWLDDNNIQYILVDQRKRAMFSKAKIKSFDFIIYPSNNEIILSEVKGRKFKGTSLAKNASLQCWVTMEDVKGLSKWETIFGQGYKSAFIFAYELEQADVETDGKDVYEFDNRSYLFYIIALDDYRQGMVLRSPKWQTVALSADNFRTKSVEAQLVLTS